MSSKRYYPHKPSRVLPLLALLGLTACAWIGTLTDPVPEKSDPFAYVCSKLYEMYFVSCATIVEPTIIYSAIVADASPPWGIWHGVYYAGERYIFINPASDKDFTEIILHEMAHYVIYELALPPKDDKCEGERVAREISDGPWDDKDKRPYGCK